MSFVEDFLTNVTLEFLQSCEDDSQQRGREAIMGEVTDFVEKHSPVLSGVLAPAREVAHVSPDNVFGMHFIVYAMMRWNEERFKIVAGKNIGRAGIRRISAGFGSDEDFGLVLYVLMEQNESDLKTFLLGDAEDLEDIPLEHMLFAGGITVVTEIVRRIETETE